MQAHDTSCNQQCTDLRLNAFITQDLSCQDEADTHVKGVMSTHCTLHTDPAPAHHALSRRDGYVCEQLKALITAFERVEYNHYIQVAVTLLPFLLLPVSHNTPTGKASLKSLRPCCCWRVVYVIPITDAISEQMAWTDESTLAVFAAM